MSKSKKLLGNKGFAWAVVDKGPGKIARNHLHEQYLIYSTKAGAFRNKGPFEEVVKIELRGALQVLGYVKKRFTLNQYSFVAGFSNSLRKTLRYLLGNLTT